MPNSSIEATLRNLIIPEQGFGPSINEFSIHLERMASQNPDITLVEYKMRYAVMKYDLDDLVKDVKLIVEKQRVSSELAVIIVGHIPSGQLDFLKSYLSQQLKREESWVIKFDRDYLEKKLYFIANKAKVMIEWSERNDRSHLDLEVSQLANLTQSGAILNHLYKLKELGIVQISDDQQNYADVDSLIQELEAIIGMDSELIDDKSAVNYKLAVSRLPNVWGIRDIMSQESQSLHASYALIRDYEQYDAEKIVEALQTLANVGFVFETNRGPRTASEIMAQVKNSLEAQGIEKIIEASKSITSLYGLDERVYKYCTEKLLAGQPKESGASRLLRLIGLWKGNQLEDLLELIRHNGPHKVFRGITQPL